MSDQPIKFKKRGSSEGNVQQDLTINPEFSDRNLGVRQYRQNAWKNYLAIPLPNGKEEDWRRTSLKEIDFTEISAEIPEAIQDIPSSLVEPLADQKHAGQVLVTPNDARNYCDQDLIKQGVVFQDLRSAIAEHPEVVDKLLSRIELTKSGKFASLAGALPLNGVVLYVPRNVKIESPLQSVYWAAGKGYVHASHVFVYLEEGASVIFVHESSSPDNDESLHTCVMEIYVGENAQLTFVELQSWGEKVVNFTQENVNIDKNGSIDWIFGALGSKLTKNYSNLNLIGEGSTGKMSGFYFTNNHQHLDHDTQQNHLAPSTTSDLLFKGALLDESRSVWQGMIYVAPNASKTDGYQANRNLVLSKGARADSIPGLEILTDDVRCTHGATVGKIDEEQIFYLKSRGMERETAERLIVEGFFDPIMQRIPFEGVKNRFQNAIKHKMSIFEQ